LPTNTTPSSGAKRRRCSVITILSHHVKLSVEAIDRMYLNVYVPRLANRTGRCAILPRPSRATAAVRSPDESDQRAFVAKLENFVARQGVPLVQFRKGERKDASPRAPIVRLPLAGV
jgi:hypothetical protein